MKPARTTREAGGLRLLALVDAGVLRLPDLRDDPFPPLADDARPAAVEREETALLVEPEIAGGEAGAAQGVEMEGLRRLARFHRERAERLDAHLAVGQQVDPAAARAEQGAGEKLLLLRRSVEARLKH